jgi:SAM-dependent methyltransferase
VSEFDAGSARDESTYDLARLEQSALQWRQHAGLRWVYRDMYRRIRNELRPGSVLELGSGIGIAKQFIPDIVTSDRLQTRFVDRALSCYEVDRNGPAWDNLMAIDVLHHLRRPLTFLAAAARALRPGGRLVLLEPAATPAGRHFYRLFHHEPMRLACIEPPFAFPRAAGEQEYANMAMAYGLFVQHVTTLQPLLAELGLRLRTLYFCDLLAYPLSGGYSRAQLLPGAVLRGLLALERRLPQLLLQQLGLRMLVVLEKTATGVATESRPDEP